MLDNIRQMGQFYYDNLPDNSIKAIGCSALCSFTVTAIFGKGSDGVLDLSRPLIAAAIASTASLIHALITPIIEYFWPSNPNWKLTQELIKQTVSVVTTSALINAQSSSTDATKFVVYGALSSNWVRALFGNLQGNDNSTYLYFY
jgi:hypothetical protein